MFPTVHTVSTLLCVIKQNKYLVLINPVKKFDNTVSKTKPAFLAVKIGILWKIDIHLSTNRTIAKYQKSNKPEVYISISFISGIAGIHGNNTNQLHYACAHVYITYSILIIWMQCQPFTKPSIHSNNVDQSCLTKKT